MKIHTYFLLIFLTFVSCDNDNESSLDINAATPHRDNGFDFIIKDSTGQNLLDPNHPNTYNTNAIRTYEIIGNDTLEIYKAHLDEPRDYSIHQTYLGEYTFRFRALSNSESSFQRVFLIEWNSQDTDRIDHEVFENTYNIEVSKIWYNGELEFDYETYTNPNNPNNPFINGAPRGDRFFEVNKD